MENRLANPVVWYDRLPQLSFSLHPQDPGNQHSGHLEPQVTEACIYPATKREKDKTFINTSQDRIDFSYQK